MGTENPVPLTPLGQNAELRALAVRAQEVEEAGVEAKLAKLEDLLRGQGFFDRPDQRLVKDTLDYLIEKLEAWGFEVASIHGSMRPGSRDEPGTRLHAEQQDCLIFNFVATNTIEGRVLQRLLDKLQETRDALDDDAVFNVVGEVLPAAHVERVLRDYYAGRLGAQDLEERLLRDVDERHFRNICQNSLEGVVPETITRFLRDAAPLVPLRLDFIKELPHTFEPARTPASLRRYERESDWRLPELAARYPRCSAHRDNAQEHALEWVTPGHPLFEAIRRHARERALDPLASGASFHSLAHGRTCPHRLLPRPGRRRTRPRGARESLRAGAGRRWRPAPLRAECARRLGAGPGSGGAAGGRPQAGADAVAPEARPGAVPRGNAG